MKNVISVLKGPISYNFDGTIDQVISRLQEIKADQQVSGVELVLSYETEYGSWGDSDRQVVNLYERRLETDEEYQERLTKESEDKERSLAHKREQLEQLKKELGEAE